MLTSVFLYTIFNFLVSNLAKKTNQEMRKQIYINSDYEKL